MSNYPVGFDASFPGYPYVDFTENVTAEQANAWIAAIQAIETTVGYGNAGTSSNPLYSSVFNTSYSTLAARLTAAETAAVGGIRINSSDALIQSVTTVNAAGASGLAADAAHTHAGVSPTALMPLGAIIMYPVITPLPTSYLLANGQGISTSTYSSLFSLMGYTYGGTGGTFNLPNYTNRFPLGAGGSIAPSPGASGGSTTISVNQMPSHSHSDTGHIHGSPGGVQFIIGSEPNSTIYTNSGSNVDHSPAWNLSANPGTTTGNAQITTTGGGQAFIPPYLGILFLIKVM